MRSPLRVFSKMTRTAPLRAVLIIPFVLLLVLTVGLTGYLSFLNGQSAVQELVERLESEVGNRIQGRMDTFLQIPELITRINADAVKQGLLDLENVEQLERYLWNQFQQFNGQLLGADLAAATSSDRLSSASANPSFSSGPSDSRTADRTADSTSTTQCVKQPTNDVTLIVMATETGNYVDIGFSAQKKLEITIRDHQQSLPAQIWRANCWGKRTSVSETLPDYDPRKRPWYQKAKQVGRPIWIGPEPTYPPESYLAVGSDYPLYDRQGNFLGVADATISLNGISDFLRGLEIGKTGQTFILQPDGSLVATSTQEQPFVDRGKDIEPLKRKVLDSQNELTRETAKQLQQIAGNFQNISQPVSFSYRLHGQRQFVRVKPLADRQLRLATNRQGLNWLVVIVIPETDFMDQIQANNRTTIGLCLLALMGALLLGIATSRWIAKPILRLSRAAEALAEGDWDQEITVQRSGELGTLAHAFVHMREQLKRSRQQLEEYSRGLEQKNLELETLERELRRQLNLFLHAVSHDLRNPVIGMSMVLQNLSEQPGDDLKLPRKFLERMIEGNHRQLDLINSLIDTHAAEMWGIALHFQPIDLSTVVEAAMVDLQPILERDHTILRNQIPADLPPIKSDPLQLGRVYQNLIANALKHNPPGLTLTLNAQLEDHWVRCTVSDNGIGIAQEQCERLFDPYFRGDQKPKSVGLGLGLYLCRQIVQAHGGVIGVQSQIGKGTTFWFTLPVADEISHPDS